MSSHRYTAEVIASSRGAALVVSLMILVVMTLIGVTAMSTSSLEVLMAGNTQLQTRALSTAENSLASAEAAIENITESAGPFNFSASDGYYQYDAGNPANNIDPAQRDWPFRSQIINREGNAVTDYVVEYFPGCRPVRVAGESVATGSELASITCVYYFRASGRSFDRDSGATRLVQSIYATAEAP